MKTLPIARGRLRVLALGALAAGLVVALLLEPAWVARNTAFVVALIGVVLWSIARDFVMGEVPTADYDALASWLFAAGRRDAYPVAQVAVVGRQGCSRAESRKLRDELRAARRALAADGVRGERTRWEAFVDRLDEAPLVLDLGGQRPARCALEGLPRVLRQDSRLSRARRPRFGRLAGGEDRRTAALAS